MSLSSNGLPSSSLDAVVSCPLIRRLLHAVERDLADEIGELGGDIHNQRRALVGRADRDVGEPSGLIEVLDRRMDVGELQLVAGMKRQQLVQIVRAEWADRADRNRCAPSRGPHKHGHR